MTKNKKIIVYSCMALIFAITAMCVILFTENSKQVYTYDIGDYCITLTFNGNHWTYEKMQRIGAENNILFEKGTFVKNGNYALLTSESRGQYATLFGKKSIHSETTLINSNVQKYVYLGKDFVIGDFLIESVLFKPGTHYAPTDKLAIMGQNRLDANYKSDVFVVKEEGDIKQNLVDSIIEYSADGEQSNFFTNTNQINSVKVNGEDFVNTLAKGLYNATVTYNTNKTFNIVIFVGLGTDNPAEAGLYFQNLPVSDVYAVPIGTTAEQFLSGKNATIKTFPGATPTEVTPNMINNFDTTKEHYGYFNVVYHGFSCSFQYSVYNPENPGAYELNSIYFEPYVQLNSQFEFSFDLLNYKNEEVAKTLDDDDVVLTGFNNHKTGLQEVSVTCAGITKNILVYVYDGNNNPAVSFGVLPNIDIDNNNSIGNLTFNMELADGTFSEPIAFNLSMLKNFNLTKRIDGDYIIEYKTSLYTFISSITVDFIDLI